MKKIYWLLKEIHRYRVVSVQPSEQLDFPSVANRVHKQCNHIWNMWPVLHGPHSEHIVCSLMVGGKNISWTGAWKHFVFDFSHGYQSDQIRGWWDIYSLSSFRNLGDIFIFFIFLFSYVCYPFYGIIGLLSGKLFLRQWHVYDDADPYFLTLVLYSLTLMCFTMGCLFLDVA